MSTSAPSTVCEKCGGKVKFGRVVDHGTFVEKRRDCPQCGHGDKIYVRITEEVLKVIEVAKRSVRKRKSRGPQIKTKRNNATQRKSKCSPPKTSANDST
jgi:transcriptional regulator NrdR family protein